MLQLSRRDIESGIKHLQSVHADYLGFKGNAEDTIGAIASQALSGVAAFGYGVAEGMYGPIKVGPVHADLLAGLVLHGAAFFGYAGKHAGAAHSLAQGFVDGHLGRIGMGIGTNLGIAKNPPHQPTVSVSGSGYSRRPPQQQIPGAPGVATDAEIASLVERTRG